MVLSPAAGSSSGFTGSLLLKAHVPLQTLMYRLLSG